MSAIEANGATSGIAMSRTLAAKSAAEKTPFYRKLYVQVLIAVALGATLGYLYPEFATSLKPFGDAFVRAIKVVVAPIIFTTIVVGIAKMGDIRRVANVGVKALIYFEIASTLALIIGMIVGNLWKVGVGLNADPAAFDTKAVEAYAKVAKNVTMSDFFLSIIPTSFVEPFVKGDIMPVLFIAVLLGFALALAQSRGKPIVNLLPLQDGERISAMLSIKEFEEGKFVFMATSLGTVKKTSLALFSRPRASGIIAVALEPGDKLVGVAITDGTKDILLFTTGGKAIRFVEEEVRAMGREAAGVRGVRLSDEQRVNALIVAEQGFILTASQNGFGKLTPLDDFPKHGRGGQGVIALQITDRNGRMVGALQVSLDDEIMLMSQNGVLVRTPVKDISVVGRNTQGVRLIRLEEGDQLSGLERIDGLAGDADVIDEGPEGPDGEAGGPPADDAPAADT